MRRAVVRGNDRKRGQRGYMLAGALLLVAVMAVGLTVVAQEWSFVHRRAMESELKFRGNRIMRAVLEYQFLQRQGRKPAGQMINSYETLEKFLTDGPDPILPALPPDPMTARYDDDGELVEGTGRWGLVVLGGARPASPTRFGSQPAAPATAASALQVVGCGAATSAGGNRSRLRGGFSERSGGGFNVLGVASCMDDPDKEPIGLSPSGEQASSYREWLFLPKEFRGGHAPVAVNTGGGNGPGAGAHASWASNWPESMPASPLPPGVGAGGSSRPGSQVPGLPAPNRRPFRGRDESGRSRSLRRP